MLRPLAGRLAVGLLALAFAGHAAADARGELDAAFKKNLAATTYRATITDLATGKQVSSVEFQAPDRYRFGTAGRPPTVVVNGKMYMTVNGRTVSAAVPPATLQQMRSDSTWKQMEKDTVITDAGLGAVGAEPAHKYHWKTTGKKASAGDIWVAVKSGLVIQVETAANAGSKAGAVRVRYTDFNSPKIQVDVPK